MFSVGSATRIYVAAGSTAMRKGFEGLFGLVRDRLDCDPLSGHVFLVRQCADIRTGETKVTLTHAELALLLGGIDLSSTRRRAWYRTSAVGGQK